MQFRNSKWEVLMTGLAIVACPISSFGGELGHEEDVIVGRTEAGQLAVEIPLEMASELPPVNGLLTGWAADEPGFLSLEGDEPKEGLFALGLGAIINIELVSIEPALKVWSPGFASVLSAPGNTFLLGGSEFDVHPTYHIDSSDPGFDSEVNLFTATFRLSDTGTTGYAPSEPFSLSFAPVPEPTTILLSGIAATALLANRRPGRVRKERSS